MSGRGGGVGVKTFKSSYKCIASLCTLTDGGWPVSTFSHIFLVFCNSVSSTVQCLCRDRALINEVNLRRTRLVLRWVTVLGSIHLFQYVTNQPPKANSAFHPSGVGKWAPASAGKAKAGMVHSDSRWTRGVQVKLWDPLRTRAIPEHLRGAFTTKRCTNPRLPLPLPLPSLWEKCHRKSDKL